MLFKQSRVISWKGVMSFGAFLAYHALRFVLIAVFSFPVAMIYVISALLLDPSVPETYKHRLPQLIIDRFDMVFQYSVTLAILLAVGIVGLLLLGRLQSRLSLVVASAGSTTCQRDENV